MAFSDMDKKASMSASERREFYKKKEQDQKGAVAVSPQKVEVLPPVDGKGGTSINLPAAIQGMTISPKIEIHMPDPEANAESRWWGVGREAIETLKNMALGAAAYVLVMSFIN